MSREMASEVKHEIREMVSQVDEMISPEYINSSYRRTSPPYAARRRIGSGTDLGLNLAPISSTLKKSPTSPLLPTQLDEIFYKKSPLTKSPRSAHRIPSLESSGPNSISFNSSETSSPETIIQVMAPPSQSSLNLPKSMSSNKLSDEEVCSNLTCRHCCVKKNWCQHPSGSSQDSGINMSFGETDSYVDYGK